MVSSPLPWAFPSPTFLRSFGAAGSILVPSAGATGTHLPWKCGNLSLERWRDPRVTLMAQAQGESKDTHKEPALLCLVAPSVNKQLFTARDKCWNKSQPPAEGLGFCGYSSLATAGAGTLSLSGLSPVVPPLRGALCHSPGSPCFPASWSMAPCLATSSGYRKSQSWSKQELLI